MRNERHLVPLSMDRIPPPAKHLFKLEFVFTSKCMAANLDPSDEALDRLFYEAKYQLPSTVRYPAATKVTTRYEKRELNLLIRRIKTGTPPGGRTCVN